MSLYTLAFRYVIFSFIAIFANLLTQRIVFLFGDTKTIFSVALGLGTLTGLILKYILDKRWIFYDLSLGLEDNSKKFALYTSMGIVTTLIFWGSEAIFWLNWKTDTMREIGAVLGLSIGYIVKYNLDRKFVFTDKHLVNTP
ncbi:GtrA family protein [Alphaproteobacteria bacterium LSUCC0684]